MKISKERELYQEKCKYRTIEKHSRVYWDIIKKGKIPGDKDTLADRETCLVLWGYQYIGIYLKWY